LSIYKANAQKSSLFYGKRSKHFVYGIVDAITSTLIYNTSLKFITNV
jgi:hypothetical protein